MNAIRLQLVLAAALCVTFCGCPEHRSFTPVAASGSVTVDGQPLPGGRILLKPTNSATQTRATAVIESDGTFVLQTYDAGDGACPGKYIIDVLPPPKEDDEDKNAARLEVPEFVVPPNMAVEIPAEGTSNLDVALSAPERNEESRADLEDEDDD